MLKLLKTLDVLLVEDDVVIQKSLQESLEYFFHKVYTAEHGLQALKLFDSGVKIDLVFTDYEMPQMDGYELILEIQKFDKKMPITIISNHDDKEKLQKCIPLGLCGYIFKPLTYTQLKDYLSSLAKKLHEDSLLKYQISNTHAINFATYELEENGTVHKLTKLESAFLKILTSQEGKVATFESLQEQLFEFALSQSTLKNLVYRLKNKYNMPCIKNIKNIGYVIVPNE